MKKILEDYLMNEIGFAGDLTKRSPRSVIEEMLENKWINNPKQAWKTLDKWVRKGKYEYGCCLDLGWKLTDEQIQQNKEYRSRILGHNQIND